MGFFDDVGDITDKLGPRALRGLLGGKPRELASVLPFSDTLGITNPEDIVSGRNLTDAAGLSRRGSTSFGSKALGFGADMLLDPTNLIGGGLVAKAGTRIARGAGGLGDLLRGLTKAPDVADATRMAMRVPPGGGAWSADMARAADALGPRYPGGREKLTDIFMGVPEGEHADRIISGLMRNPFAERIAGEVPEGSTYLGHGTEALALKTPEGGVIRLGPYWSHHLQGGGYPAQGRPDIPEMLQPFRANLFGPHLVEHLPEVNPLFEGHAHHRAMQASPLSARLSTDLKESAEGVAQHLGQRVMDRYPGLNPWDVYHRGNARPWNVALTDEGKGIIHDAGAIMGEPPIPHPGIYTPTPEEVAAFETSGGAEAVRRAMQQGLAMGTRGQGVGLPSGLDPGLIMANRDELARLMEQLVPLHARAASRGRGVVPGASGINDTGINAMLGIYESGSEFLPPNSVFRSMMARAAAQARRPETVGPPRWLVPPPHMPQGTSSVFSASQLERMAANQVRREGELGYTRGMAPADIAEPIRLEPRNSSGVAPSGVTPTGRGTGGLDPRFRAQRGAFSLERLPPGGAAGYFDPVANRGAFAPGFGRHEAGHGILHQAIAQGNVGSLPLAWQPAARLQASRLGRTGWGSALGEYLEELAMHGAQERGLPNQLAGMGRFLASPEQAQFYGSKVHGRSPMVARMMQIPPFVARNPELGFAAAMAPYELARVRAALERD